MLSPACRARVWASLHEPRAVTAFTVAAYILTVIAGLAVAWLTLATPGERERDIVLALFALSAVLSGGIGAPSAWTGRHYREGVAALGLVLTGFLAVTDAALILTDPDPLRPRIAALAAWGGLQAVLWGCARYAYLRTAGPYAPGHGPQTPEHRIVAAQIAMEHQEVEAQRRAAAATTKGA